MMPWTSLLLFSHQIQASGQQKTQSCWQVHSDWSDTMFLTEVRGQVHSQRASCFVGCKAEPKVTSWTETTLWQLFKNCLSVMWTSTFHVLFTTDFVFCKCKPGVLLFLHHQDTVSPLTLVSRTHCPIMCTKNVQHWDKETHHLPNFSYILFHANTELMANRVFT